MISNKLFYKLYNYNGNYKTYNTQQIINGELTISSNDVYIDCLKWAWKNNYGLTIQPFWVEIFSMKEGVCEKILKEKNGIPYNKELVFKSCEWILEKINNSQNL